MEGPKRTAGVCAIVVHHRGHSLLAGCLEALLASTGVELEVVVVANACREPLPRLALASPRVHVVESATPLGFSEANNLGARWAAERWRGPRLLFFVNNDALVAPDAVARLAAALADDPKRGIVGPRLMLWGGEGLLNSLGLNITLTGQAWDEGIGLPWEEYRGVAAARTVLAVTGAALMVRAQVLRRLGGWAELYDYYCEDLDLCLRARSHGLEVVCVTDAVVEHAISATAARGSSFKVELSWRNRFLLLLAHWPAALLLRQAPRLAWSEGRLYLRRRRLGAAEDARRQRDSWVGALRRLPAALRQRGLRGLGRGWVTLLRPHGSVPEIRLPPLPEFAEDVSGDAADHHVPERPGGSPPSPTESPHREPPPRMESSDAR